VYSQRSRYLLAEPIIKLVILAPLLRLAGFYRSPFYLAAEKEVQIKSEDEGWLVRGQIKILVFHPQFWITLIDAKNTQYSLEVGVPPALTDVIATPTLEKGAYGFVSNGRFEFLRLTRQEQPKYARSHPFSIDQGDDRYTVLAALKQMAQIAQR